MDKFLTEKAAEFINSIPFCRFLGVRLERVEMDKAITSFVRHDDLIGNHLQNILHGGVISSVLDTTGGLIAVTHLFDKIRDLEPSEQLERLSRLGTIDIRIDYLRPGYGERFMASASILRIGNKVAVTRMELHNDQQDLIALGTGTYLVG